VGLKVLVVGGGGREHALVWKIAQSPLVDRIYAAPGNPGMAKHAELAAVTADDLSKLRDFAVGNRIDLTVVGPEAPLAAGLTDLLAKEGLLVCGPSKAAAQLEGSKVFTKNILAKYGIPTADFRVFDDYDDAEQYVLTRRLPVVIKADGLAAGKGVAVAGTYEEAVAFLREVMEKRVFGAAGERVVVEDCLTGEEASYIVFTDGACSGNPGPGGWAAVIWTPDAQVRELGGREPSTTNNRMELKAAIEALSALEGISGPARVYTDSSYVIGGATSWLGGWKKRGWRKKDETPVLNRDLWEELDSRISGQRSRGGVSWSHVRGHAGSPGNERCDAIAVAFSLGKRVKLFSGRISGLGYDLSRLPQGHTPLREPVYLSCLNGELGRHAKWLQCEARVKGHPKAKYKKVRSVEEEAETLRRWGLIWPED